MKRVLATLATLAVLLPIVVTHSGPAVARTAKKITLTPRHRGHALKGSKTFDTTTGNCPGDACDDFPIHLKNITKRFLRRHHVVLDVLIKWKKPDDGFNLELDQYDPKAKEAGTYIRSSQTDTVKARGKGVNVPLVQHVAVWLRPDVKFSRWFDINVTPAQDEGGYSGRVQLLFEKPHWYFPSAGFAVKNLSLISKRQNTSRELTGAGEPSIAIGPDDSIYVSAPLAVPAVAGSGSQPDEGVAFFASHDHGKSWVVSNQGSQSGGGDSDVVADTATGLYLEDLAAATITTFKSTDKGATFSQTQPVSADTDREWLATYLPDPSKGTDSATVYTAYHGLANQNVFICTSTDGGQSNTCTNGITDPTALQNSACNTDMGNDVVDSKGNVDFVFATSTPAENAGSGQCLGALHNLYLGHLDKATGLVTNTPIYLGPAGHWLTGLFPLIAIDKSDNLYAFWPESATDKAGQSSGPWSLRISHSTDGGAHWSAPATINPPTLKNNLLNWITVGDAGKINIVWAGTTSSYSSYNSRAKWYMFFAQSTNGLDANPTFTYRQITPHPIRYGSVCVLGILCPSDDSRHLLDFTQVEVDKECRANVVFGDNSAYIPWLLTSPNGVFGNDDTTTDFAVQRSKGSRICTPGTGGAGGSGSYTAPA